MGSTQCQNLRVMAVWFAAVAIVLVVVPPSMARAQLSSTFYASSCPNLESTVRSGFLNALSSDGRIGASILRMSFHDCFVQGCDASILLDDTPTFTGEQSAGPNVNTLRGLNVIDDIKTSVEAICPNTVSCADIIQLVAKEGVVASGGPSWTVELGRRDSTTASLSGANNNIPAPTSDVATLISKFAAVRLSELDMVTLAGAHTFGKAHCSAFSSRLTNSDPTLDPGYRATLEFECPTGVSTSVIVNLDQGTPTTFDNTYYTNLLSNKGLLTSDQSLESEGGSTASTVSTYAGSQNQFFSQFTASMINMAAISPLTGSQGEIRTNCNFVNS